MGVTRKGAKAIQKTGPTANGSINGNTNFIYTITGLNGAKSGDFVSCGFNNNFYNAINSAGNDHHLKSKCDTDDEAELTLRFGFFQPSGSGQRLWGRIVK